MARGGFLGRIVRGVKNVIGPGRRRRPAPTPPPPPPPGPGGPPPPGPGGGNPYQRVWKATAERRVVQRIHDDTGDSEREIFRAHLDVFSAFPLEYDDEAERLEFWEQYIQFMVNGRERRNDPLASFWQASGIDPRYDFDWEDWRTAMGYSRNAR